MSDNMTIYMTAEFNGRQSIATLNSVHRNHDKTYHQPPTISLCTARAHLSLHHQLEPTSDRVIKITNIASAWALGLAGSATLINVLAAKARGVARRALRSSKDAGLLSTHRLR